MFPNPRLLSCIVTIFLMLALSACDSSSTSPSVQPTRTWQMGFYQVAPRYGDVPLAVQNIDLFSQRAELVVHHQELPWDLLLDGTASLTTILDGYTALISYYRSKGLNLFFMADLTDGLSRGEEPPKLRALSRSITESAVQQRYRDYVVGFVQRFQPEYIGLTAETNLVRREALATVYAAVVQASNDAATDLIALGVTAPLLISVQVQTAWGGLGGAGTYVGIEQDFTDFPFMNMLGLSSYPYFDYAQPEDLPDNYYTRLLNGRTIDTMVAEGGWPSVSVGSIVSSPEIQASYITRHADLLDSIQARAMAQTLFTDLDLSSIPFPYPANLPLFATLGLMELSGNNFVAKPSLAAWDALYVRNLQ